VVGSLAATPLPLLHSDEKIMEKIYLPPLLSYLVYFTPTTMKPSVLPPELSKTVYFTPWAVFSGGFATVTAGEFLFIFGEFLKNYSKS